WSGLGLMLQRLGVVKDPADANQELNRVPGRHARDILCSLWYLVPETRSQFSESLRDEYCRLGAVRGGLASMAQQIAIDSDVAKRAYEFVTVTSSLNLGVPVEVLVRALKIDYSEW